MLKANVANPKERSPLFPGQSCFPFSTQDAYDYRKPTDQLNVILSVIGSPSSGEVMKFKDLNVRTVLQNMKQFAAKDLTRRFPATNHAGVHLLTQMLRFDANKRISVQQALLSAYFEEVRDPELDLEALARQRETAIFEFEDVDVDEETVRALILDEIMCYNPRLKKQLQRQFHVLSRMKSMR